MSIITDAAGTVGTVPGPYGEATLVCQFIHKTNSQGSTWFGGDPFSYTVPLLLAQFTFIFVVTSLIYFILKPCKQGLISAQLIVTLTLTLTLISLLTLKF